MNFFDRNNKENCCGCTACKTICPKHAISFRLDEKGFLYPFVDENLCIKCGLCEEVCDFKKFKATALYPDSYILKHSNFNEVWTSQSGGAFMVLCDYVLQHNGYICGCELQSKNSIVHKIENIKSGVNKFKGSKYVQSDMNDCFDESIKLLQKGKLLLFSGTGCQVHGFLSLCNLTNTDTTNLITCDLICHGCPSISVWKAFISELERRNKKNIKVVDFRDKRKFGWHSHIESFVFEDETTTTTSWANNFYQHSMFRESCYNCVYTTTNRKTDFTIGDCWGIERVLPEMDDNQGVSLVLVRTEKAKQIFEEVKKDTCYASIDLSKVMQPQLSSPPEKSSKYDKFWESFVKDEKKCIKRYFFPSKIRIFICRCLRFAKRCIRRIFGKVN